MLLPSVLRPGSSLHTATILLLLAVTAAACAPTLPMARAPEPVATLPAIPARDGAVDLHVVYPPTGARKPDVDSTFIFGSTGTGEARLTINEVRVPVAPNGAFLAYLPVPESGEYRLIARAHGRQHGLTVVYAQPAPASRRAASFEPSEASEPPPPIDAPLVGVVTGGLDTLATGSEIAHGAPTPGADRRWFFPRSARVVVTERQGGLLHVQLTDETSAWVDASMIEVSQDGPAASATVDSLAVRPQAADVDVTIPVDYAPFRIDTDDRALAVTVYRRQAGASALPETPSGDGLIADLRWTSTSADSSRLELALSDYLWGYKAFYDEDGALVLRVRRPVRVDVDHPLQGVRVMVDPGHPPAGATGPTGLRESAANLAIAKHLVDLLRDRGADVITTRTTEAPVGLWERVDEAVAEDADLLVSIHNNAFPNGVNPFLNYGTEAYYYHDFSAPLARSLVGEIVDVTGIPDLGAKQRSLALVRSTWMPSVLTESLFMMFPQQEAALQNPDFLERLAAAHLRGIEAFLRSRATEAASGN